MLVQTSSADIPVTLSNHKNTTPSPQIVVRNVKHERVRDILEKEYHRLMSDLEKRKYLYVQKRWNGYPTLIHPPKDSWCVSRVSE